jgi:hypothetical protein
MSTRPEPLNSPPVREAPFPAAVAVGSAPVGRYHPHPGAVEWSQRGPEDWSLAAIATASQETEAAPGSGPDTPILAESSVPVNSLATSRPTEPPFDNSLLPSDHQIPQAKQVSQGAQALQTSASSQPPQTTQGSQELSEGLTQASDDEFAARFAEFLKAMEDQ